MREHAIAHTVANGANDSALHACRAQHVFHEHGYGRLAGGSRYAHNLHALRGVSKEIRRRLRKDVARIGDDCLRHRKVELALDNQHGRTPLCGRWCKVMPVMRRARHAREERPRLNATRVVRHVRYHKVVGRPPRVGTGHTTQHFAKFHGCLNCPSVNRNTRISSGPS